MGWTLANIESKKNIASKHILPAITANALTKQALRVLDLIGYRCWRQNNAAVFDATKKVYRANSSTKGISDIIGYHKKTGQFLACEIKVGKDKLSVEQQEFLNSVTKAGGLAIVIKTTTDLENILKLNRK